MKYFEENNLPDSFEIRYGDNIDFVTIESELPLLLTIRASTSEIEVDDVEIEFGFSRVWLAVFCEGTRVKSSGRLGEPIQLTSSQKTQTEHVQLKQTVKAGANAGMKNGIPVINVNAGGQLEGIRTVDRKNENVIETRQIVAKPNDRWILKTDNNDALDGTLVHENELCRLMKDENSNANRNAFSLIATARKKDLVIKSIKDGRDMLKRFKGDITKEKIMKALIGKIIQDFSKENNQSLAEIENSETIGVIKLSEIGAKDDD